MLREQAFHEDVFYAYFSPYRHPCARFNIWGGYGLETFGEDLELVKSSDANYVWTVVEGDTGTNLWITPGLHFVNRICYLVTHVRHAYAPVVFCVETKPQPISAFGLSRRMTTLRKLMQNHQDTLDLAY